MDGLKWDMDGLKRNMDFLKGTMDGLKGDLEGLKANMEGLKEGLETLLEERLHNDDKVSHETHDKNRKNLNNYFTDCNFGLKTNHILKIDMRGFDGKNPVTCYRWRGSLIYMMCNTQKRYAYLYLYLEPNKFVWYRMALFSYSVFHLKKFYQGIESTLLGYKINKLFNQLINIKQNGLVGENIENFQILNIKVNYILEDHMIDLFIGTLKDNIQHEVHLWKFKSSKNEFRVERKFERKYMETRKYTTPNYKDVSVSSPTLPQPTRLTP